MLNKYLEKWQKETRHKFDNLKLVEYQRLLDKPYILSKCQDGHYMDLLVATNETVAWFDRNISLYDIVYAYQFRMIKQNDIVFDLGCHHGLYSVWLGKHTNHIVYGFDPFPVNIEVAKINTEINKINFVPFQIALSSNKGKKTVCLCKQRIDPVDSSLKHHNDGIEIDTDVLDNYAYLKPDFIKIDIEGAEIDALVGATELLKQRPNIMMEVHTSFFRDYGYSVENLLDFLPLKDYIVYMIHPGKEIKQYKNREDFKITEHCVLYLMREEPCSRTYLDE